MFRGVVVFPLVPLLVLLGGFPAAAQGSISLSPSSGPVGTTVVLSAAQVQQMGGLGPCAGQPATGDVLFQGRSAASASTRNLPDGGASFTVPSLPSGQYQVLFFTCGGGLASATFTVGSAGIPWTAVWNGRRVALDYHNQLGHQLVANYGTCGPTGCVPGAHVVGWISDLQTTDLNRSCMDGATLPVWTTPLLPGDYVVFINGDTVSVNLLCQGPPYALTFPTSDGPPPTPGQLSLSLRVTPNPAAAGGDVTLTATLSQPVSGGKISFSSDPSNLTSFPNGSPPCRPVNGTCSGVVLVPDAGRWTIRASWSGDLEYRPADSPPAVLTSFSSCGNPTCYWGLGWGDRSVAPFSNPLPITWNTTPCLGICYGSTFQNLPAGITGATALTAGVADQGVQNWIWATYVPPCLTGTCADGARDQVRVRAHLVTVLLSNDIGALANVGTSLLWADADWPYVGQQHADLGLSTYVTIDASALDGEGEAVLGDLDQESDDGFQAAAAVVQNALQADTQAALSSVGSPDWSQAVANLDQAVQSGGVGPSFYSTTWEQDFSMGVGHPQMLGFSPQLMAANAGLGATGAFAVTFVQLEVSAVSPAGAPVRPSSPVVLRIGSPEASQAGSSVSLPTAPVIRDGRTMLPLASVARLLGAQVTWNGATRQVILVRGGQELVMTLGSASFLWDGVALPMDTAPYIQPPGYTMVPVSFVAQAFGMPVRWDGATRQVTIGSAGG
jgi:hypothetical protein